MLQKRPLLERFLSLSRRAIWLKLTSRNKKKKKWIAFIIAFRYQWVYLHTLYCQLSALFSLTNNWPREWGDQFVSVCFWCEWSPNSLSLQNTETPCLLRAEMRSLFAYESVFREGKKANRIWHYLRGAKHSSCAVRRLGKADVCMCVCLCVCVYLCVRLWAHMWGCMRVVEMRARSWVNKRFSRSKLVKCICTELIQGISLSKKKKK